MNRAMRVILGATVLAGLLGCSSMKAQLTDAQVAKYCVACKAIRVAVPGMDIQHGGTPSGADLVKLDAAVKGAGFKDYTEFVKVNGIVLLAMMKAAGTQADAGLNAAKAAVEGQLEDPNVPEAMKTQLREQLAQLEKGHVTAKGATDKLNGLSGMLVDPAAVEVVKRHAAEIQAAMTGR